MYLRGRVWLQLSCDCCLGNRSLLLVVSPLFCLSLSRLYKCCSVSISSFVCCSSSLNVISVVLQWTFTLSVFQLHSEIVSKHIPIIRMAWTAFRGKSGRIYEHLQMYFDFKIKSIKWVIFSYWERSCMLWSTLWTLYFICTVISWNIISHELFPKGFHTLIYCCQIQWALPFLVTNVHSFFPAKSYYCCILSL